MAKKALIGILLGSAGLMLACLCAPFNILPLRWTPTAEIPTLAPTFTFTSTQIISPTQESFLTVTPDADSISVCVYHLSQDLEESEHSYAPGTELEADFTLVTYTVSGDSIIDPVKVSPIPPSLKSLQENAAAQKSLWEFFTHIIPADQRTEVTEFAVFTDGPNNSLGAVEQTNDPRHWKLEMDIQDSQNFADLSTTLVHEFAHLLTLNEAQVAPDMQVFNHPNDGKIYAQAQKNCPTYFMFEGCSQPDSYINKFFQRFWPGIYAEWKQIAAETNDDKRDRALNRFYNRYSDQFVSDYAVTSPEEDIAETFMYFIFTPRPSEDTIADQKILFFYDDPKMVALREQLLAPLCRFAAKP